MNIVISDYLVNKIEKAFSDSYKSVNNIIKDHVKSEGNKPIVLDIGSGTGSVTKKISEGCESKGNIWA